jgi:hypothetical protein
MEDASSAAEPRFFGTPPNDRTTAPSQDAASRNPREINERRTRTENADLLRRIRSL